MTNDAEQLEQLTAYLDGELAPAQRAEVDRLLAEDPDARALFHELQQTSRLVSALPRASAPEGLADAVVNRLERRELIGESSLQWTTRPPAATWSRRIAVAASITLVGTAVWIAWPHLAPLALDEKQPLKLAQADKPVMETTPPATEGRGQSELEISRSLRPSPRSSFGDAPARSKARTRAPLALGYLGDEADREAPAEEAAADDETTPTSAERFVAKLERLDEAQPAAPAAIVVEPSQTVTVEADAATIARLTALVERDMARHAVPRIPADAPGQAAPGEGTYFTLRRATLPSPIPPLARTGSPPVDRSGDEVRIVLRAPRDVAGRTLARMYQISKEADATAGWTMVGRLFGPPRAAGRAPDREQTASAAGGVKKAGVDEEPTTFDRPEPDQAASRSEQDAANANKEGYFEERGMQAPSKDGRRSDLADSASQPVPPMGEPLVTLTIHLKARPEFATAATTQPSTQPAEAPMSQAKPRATTQEVPGG